ncbi:type I polyketide synthase [Neorhizobium petrolearium]|uniref:type I polyketide synthase n=1 Tax=Neorhizobium petrolearium TaxID=515361 RepID=UPI003F7F0569
MTIEIIGRACVAPGANSVQELQKVLSEGRCTITRIPDDRWECARFWHPAQGVLGKTYTFAAGVLDDIYAFDPAVFGLSQREAMQMDPQQRVLLNLVWQALEDANLPWSKLSEERVGVYIGASSLEAGNLISEDPASGSPYFMTGNTLSIVSNRISHVFGLKGPSMTIDTACSSSLVALDQAAAALEKGDIDTAIVGGVNLLVHPLSFVGFAQARMLSPEGLCRAYDTNGHGYVRSEGGVAIVLRRSDRARLEQDRSYARLHAVAVNSSGRTNFISLPSREAQAALLHSIYENNAIDVNRLAFIEGHGTGTRVGDPAEVWAIGTVIGQNRRAPVPIGSIKTNIGHTEPASGLFGLLKAMIALEENFLPASLHIEKVNEDIDFDSLNVRVNTSAVKLLPAKEARFAGVNSFGFGGTNAHVVISDPERQAPLDSPKTEGSLFVASAHTVSALSRLLEDYKTCLSMSKPEQARRIISATAANREILRHRFAVEARDSEGVLTAIEAHLAGEASQGERGEAPAQTAKIAFVFSGNGAQWAGMGVEAYRENRHFRQCFQSFSALFEYHLGEKLTDLLEAPDLALRLGDTKIAQPLLFAVQAALSDCLVALGVRPDAVFGHSVGEIAAAYAAKALTAAEAVAIVAKRSKYQDIFAGQGKMAAVVLNEEAARAFAKSQGLDNICVAAINAPNSVTISGPTEEIHAFRDAARKAQIVAHVLDINYPFHHPIIDEARDAFLADLPQIEPETGTCAYISTVTGEIQDGRGLDAEYWWHNVREPVLFKTAAQVAMEIGCNLFIEISPRPILSNYLSDIAKHQSVQAVVSATLQREAPMPGRDPVAQSFARAVAHGASPLLSRHSGKRNASVDLPSLPFEPIELKSPPTTDEIDVFGRNNRKPYTLLGWRSDPNAPHWKNHIDARLFPDLAEHVVDSRAILPGSGFIEIAVTAAQRYHGTDEVEISNLEIVRPLELRQDRMVELSTLLSPETGYIEIRSRERLSHDDWTVHAIARTRRPVDGENGVPMELPQGGQGTAVTSGEAYETAERFGLQYGPRFQLLSSATAYGRTFVEVNLKPAEAPAHPFVEYNLNPFSVDAAFHGLVALFDQLSGNETGAPYIPVRFGSIRVSGTGGPIARAMIEIERFSGFSLKVRFWMFDAEGNVVATFDDCRFRRTSLRRHHTLASVAFHYESVPSTLFASETGDRPGLATVFGSARGQSSDNATLLLDAAIYRACHEIAAMLADNRGVISTRRLPGDAEFRSFLTNCLFVLEDAGIATADEGEWHIPREFTLPPVSEILQEIYREDAGRVAEAVLVKNAYRDALARLSIASLRGGDESVAKAETTSEAMLDHVLVHSPLAERRLSAVVEAVEAALAERNDAVRSILEAGTTSVAFSRRLAAIAAEKGAMLIIAEPREGVRRTLEIAFEHDVHVVLPEIEKLGEQPIVDLVIAAGTESQRLLASDEQIRAAIRLASAKGAALLFADRAPSAFNDFVFGQSEGWFESIQPSEFPIGRLGASRQVEDLIATLGFERPHAEERAYPEGALILAMATSVALPQEDVANEAATPIVMFSEADRSIAADEAAIEAVDIDADEAALADAFARLEGQTLRLVYVAERTGARDASALAQDRLRRLGLLAETLSAYSRNIGTAAVRPTLLIVAPGGSPLAGDRTDGANAGLWTFARVLQNEYDAFDVHLLDAETDEITASSLPAEIFAASTTNREWMTVGNRVREVRAAAGPFPSSDVMRSDYPAATIRQFVSGRVDSIAWEACDLPVPDKHEVVIAVEATGLNFRDVMWAMGLLPEEALEDGFAGATIGMELAGRVVEVGSAVTDLAPGDRVMGIAPAAFSTHVRVRRDGVTKFPDRMGFCAAATVPVTFLTAYYAMVHLGHIERGETILIHGAAGGVGLAALQIAKLKGATVIATAGTVEKRRFLEALGADHIFDSRSLDFVSRVRGVTNGEGVDLVLNSLFSEAMERSIELVKPFGRFLELGKRDYYSDRKIGLRPFRRNISYFGIDADQLLVNLPKVTGKIFAEIGRLFADGKLTPLPYRAFAHDEIGSAFRLMQNAGHIGKIVVRPPAIGRDKVLAAPGKPLRFSGDGVFLVAGGIGGFGLVAADWLVAKGALRIALCSRRGVADAETHAAIAAWQKKGVNATVHACDITDEAATASLLELLRSEGPVKGIVHAAMVLDDALLANLTPDRNKPVVDVKVRGAEVLHRLTAGDDLELFLLFSSATTMIGNPGQANYVIANGYLEGLARARRAAGLPALAVGFGAIADTGFLARNAEVNEILAKRIGKTAMKAREALEQVERYMVADTGSIDAATVMIAEVDWSAVRMLPIARGAIFETIIRQAGSNSAVADGDTIDLEEMIHGKSAEEAQQILHNLVAAEIAAILRVAEDTITPEKVLKEIGLDSLMAMELGMGFQQKTGFDIPLSGVGDDTTVGDVVTRLRERVSKHNDETEDASPGQSEVVDRLVKSHSVSREQKAATQ